MKQTANVDASIVMKSLEKQAAPAIKQISNLQIKSKEDYAAAATIMKSIKVIAKLAEEKENELIAPSKRIITDAKLTITNVQTFFKPFRDQVALLDKDTKDKMLGWKVKADEAIKELGAKFEDGDIKKVSTFVSKTSALTIDSNVRKTWTAVEVNVNITPRGYMVPDMQLIKEALKAGRKVSGWEWRQVDSISI